MGTETFAGRAITLGYPWTIKVQMTPATVGDPPYFPDGVELLAHVRYKTEDTAILTTLSTLNQNIVRIDDNTISITVPGSASENWKPGKVVLDLARTDVDPDTYVGIKLTVPTRLPVTRGQTQP